MTHCKKKANMRVTTELTYETIVARIERLPVSGWHRFVRLVLGTATFFDAFDAVTIAFVAPVLAGIWHLGPIQIGFLFSSGYAGQLIGAVLFGWVGERHGRIFTINLTILIISVFGLASAFAWSYGSLLAYRFVQGLGIGGENPVAATYVNEIAKARGRGRFVMLYQILFPLGFTAASLSSVWVIPHLGWRWLFVMGALPAFLLILIQRRVPESPRWLARNGKLEEADAVLAKLEAQIFGDSQPPVLVPAPAGESRASVKFIDLFRGIYLGRTFCVWVMWFCASLIGYGLLLWLPSLFHTVYQLSVDQSLQYSVLGNVTVLFMGLVSAFVIDRVGRKTVFALSYLFAGLPLFVLWILGEPSALSVMILAALGVASISAAQLALWTYTPEIYPTRMRSLGTGAGSSWARAASMIAPPLVGMLLSATHEARVIFLFLAAAGFFGALTVLLFGTETSGRVLEEISP
jgi:putative MFS transporter